jgi:hypothetical protein
MKSFTLTADQLEGNSCGLDDWGSVPYGMKVVFVYPEWIKSNPVLYALGCKSKVSLSMKLLMPRPKYIT